MSSLQSVTESLPILLKALKLPQIERHWLAFESQARQSGWSYGQFLLALCEIEQQQRSAARIERYLRDAQLPRTKSLTNFDFSCCPTVNREQVLQLATDPSWLSRGENLLILGPSGVGKTHLAAGVSRCLIELGHRVKLASATCLVQQLQQAKAELQLPLVLAKLDKYDLLVIDDIGYVKRTEAETSVLFELVAHRYEVKSLLITSNQTFSEWDSIFADATMTVAAVDRLIHHATIVEIQSQSFRQQAAFNRSGSTSNSKARS